MSKKLRIGLIILSIILCIVLCCSMVIYFLFVHHYKGTEKIYNWAPTDEFKIDDIPKLTKSPNKDFVILNLADVQMCDLEDFFNRRIIHDEISHLVEKTKPDLITLTGDQVWSNENRLSLQALIGWLDDYKIPYAPVFGNHDYGNKKNSSTAELNYCCDLYENSKYCLFNRGPSNIGSLGNYVINITENDKIIRTLYMIDSGYENKISDNQLAWMKWNADGIKQVNNGEYSAGMVFLHKPIPEYWLAYQQYKRNEIEPIGDIWVKYSLSGSEQNGFFTIAKECSVSDIVCGHQHGNCFTLPYNDVRLTFALKTGELGGYYADDDIYLNGATTFTIKQNEILITNNFVPRDKFHITEPINQK